MPFFIALRIPFSSPSQSFVYLIISFQAKVNFAARSYDSEDENMGRKKGRPFETGPCSRAPVYSKGDIREQVRLARGRSCESERIAAAPNVPSHLPGKCRQWLSSQKQLPRPTKKKRNLNSITHLRDPCLSTFPCQSTAAPLKCVFPRVRYCARPTCRAFRCGRGKILI